MITLASSREFVFNKHDRRGKIKGASVEAESVFLYQSSLQKLSVSSFSLLPFKCLFKRRFFHEETSFCSFKCYHFIFSKMFLFALPTALPRQTHRCTINLIGNNGKPYYELFENDCNLEFKRYRVESRDKKVHEVDS